MVSYLRYIFLLVFLISQAGFAHEVRPAVADIQFMPGGEIRLSIEVNLEALIAEIDPKYTNTDESPEAQRYTELRSLPAAELLSEYTQFAPGYIKGMTLLIDEMRVNLEQVEAQIPVVGDARLSRISQLIFRSRIPGIAREARFAYPAVFGNVAVKFRQAGEQAKSVHWLTQGQLSPAFPLNEQLLPRSGLETAKTYTRLGFVHIVPGGIDHILFVLGLFLLSLKMGPLLAQITAFTLAHSITLGLSIYGVIALSPLIVEPLIALSIAYVGIENIVRGHNSASRIVVIFLFGLLHGLGFSSVLTDIGLPRDEFLMALLSFNVGVEFGQLAVIAIAGGAVYLTGLARHRHYRQWVTIPGSALISVVGLYWFIERTVGLPW